VSAYIDVACFPEHHIQEPKKKMVFSDNNRKNKNKNLERKWMLYQ
jgi:hypothetical protein